MINIGGLLRFSLLDYPGKISAVIFTQGCPLRCVYCHRPDLQNLNVINETKFEDIIKFLDTRAGLLEGVVFSGGEPLLQKNLYEAIEIVKNMGFSIGLHTSGCLYDSFIKVLPMVDWVGFDIKQTFGKYSSITQIQNSEIQIEKSFKALVNTNNLNKNCNINNEKSHISINESIKQRFENYNCVEKTEQANCVHYEIRTTVDTRYISYEDLIKIAKYLVQNGVEEWTLQKCIIRSNKGDINIPFLTEEQLIELKKYLKINVR